jgi:transcriptional regulator with XRE-family HTH domain
VALAPEEAQIGKRIRLVRKEVGVSQHLAAQQMALSRDQLNRIERGEVAIGCFAALRFCREANINPLWLAFGEPENRFGFFSPDPGHTNDDIRSRFLQVMQRDEDRYRGESYLYTTNRWPQWERDAKKNFAKLSIKHYFIHHMSPPTWDDLRQILVFETQSREAKLALARRLGVSLSAVSQWRSGASAPTADNALQILRWIGERAAKSKQQKQRAGASTPARKLRKPR